MSTKKYVSLDKLGLYDEKIKGVISAGDAAALAAASAAETAAKAYADGLASNYDVAGAAATAEGNAKSYTDAEVAKANTAAAEAAAAAATADGKAVAAQGEVDALETYVGTIPEGATATNVVAYIQEKTAGIATEGAMTELDNRVTAVEGDVATIKGDYLKAADKTELAGDIADVQAAVEGEAARADAAEKANAAAIKAISDDYLKAADKTELQGNIDTVSAAVERLTNGVSADEVDGVNDLIQYVKDHGTEVTGMQEDISDNADAIAGVAGRVETLEGEMDAVQGAVATKVEQETYNAKVAELAGADTALSGRIDALDAKFGEGEGTVGDMIADAIEAEASRVDGLLENKVEKVEGKGLSTNDLTNDLKGNYDAAYAHSQEAHSPANAQANVIESVKVNGVALTITDKAVDVAVPTDNSQLANGAGYLVAADIANKADKGTTLAAYGISDAYTSTQTDTAIANAMANFVECSEEEIAALFA